MPRNDVSDSWDDRVNEVIVQFLEAEQRGEIPQVEAYLKRFPEYARTLQSFFENYQRLRSVVPEADFRNASTVFPRAANGDTSKSGPIGSPRSDTGNNSQGITVPWKFGRYRIERLLGKGGMGSVYLAEDQQLQRKVAIKIPTASLVDEPDQANRFEREARAAALLRHPNICTVYDVGEFKGIRYLTMAYIDGAPLSKVLSSSKPIPPKKSAAAIWKLALALQHAHDLGIVHRDLKSANVMIDRRGEPILMDFGLARFTNPEIDVRLTQTGAFLGTPAYMSPEHWSGDSTQVGPAADVYCLGMVFYEILTGRLPFQGQISQLVRQILFDPPPPLKQYVADIPDVLEEICLKMIAKQPSDRYSDMSDVAHALANFLRDPDAAVISSPQNQQPAIPSDLTPSNDTKQALVDPSVLTAESTLSSMMRTSSNKKSRRRYAIASVLFLVTIILTAFYRIPRDKDSSTNARVVSQSDTNTEQLPTTSIVQPKLATLEESPGNEVRLNRTLTGPDSPGVAIDFSSNGQTVSAVFESGEVRVWDLEKGELVSRFQSKVQPLALFLLPGGDQLIVVPRGDSRAIGIWSAKSGKQTDEFEAASGIISCASLNLTAGLLAAGTETNGVFVWGLADRKLKPLTVSPQSISAVAFAPDGNTLLSGDEDGKLAFISLNTAVGKRTVSDLKGHDAKITGIAPFFDNRHALTTAVNGEMCMWDIETGQKWKDYGRHEGGVGSLRLMPGIHGSRYAISNCLDGLLQVWDLEERRVIHEVESLPQQAAVAFSSDGGQLASFRKTKRVEDNDPNVAPTFDVVIWRVPELSAPRGNFPGPQDPGLQRPTEMKSQPIPADSDPGGEIPFLQLVHVLTGHTGPVTSVCMTSDSRLGFTSGGWPNGDGVIRKWDLQNGRPDGFLPINTDFVTGIAITPDGNLLFSGSNDGPTRLWNGVNGGELIRFPAKAMSTAITQNGSVGFSIAENGHVWFWDLEPNKKPTRLLGLSKGKMIRLSPNEQLVAASGLGNGICVWNVNTVQKAGKPLHVFQNAGVGLEDVQFSPDGKSLAAIDTSGQIGIWDLGTEKLKVLMKGHGKNTPKSEKSPARELVCGTALAFVAKGRYLISAGKDETLRLWNVDSGDEIGRQLVPGGFVISMAMASGQHLLTGGEPFTVDPARKTEKPAQVHFWRLNIPQNARP